MHYAVRRGTTDARGRAAGRPRPTSIRSGGWRCASRGRAASSSPCRRIQSELHRAADEATQAGDLDWAVAAYTKLLSLELSEMSRVIALASRGKVRMQQREYGAAIRDFERALELIDYPDLHDLLDEARALEAGELTEPPLEADE